jgi:hypothetical protein
MEFAMNTLTALEREEELFVFHRKAFEDNPSARTWELLSQRLIPGTNTRVSDAVRLLGRAESRASSRIQGRTVWAQFPDTITLRRAIRAAVGDVTVEEAAAV